MQTLMVLSNDIKPWLIIGNELKVAIPYELFWFSPRV